MNQSKAFLTSLILAAVAMGLVYVYVSDRETKINERFGNSKFVIVASEDINEFEEITEDKLKLQEVPQSFVQPGAIEVGDPEDSERFASVRGAIASAPFRKGEQILNTKVLLKGAATGLAPQVAVSYRALSITVDDTKAVTRLIKPGDRVDIIANIPYKGAKGDTEYEVRTVLQNVLILAAGEQIQNEIPQVFERDPFTNARVAKNLMGSRNFNTVTIEVTPKEAQVLVYIQEVLTTGLFLTLRNPIDRVVSSLETTTLEEVLGPNSKKAIQDRLNQLNQGRPVQGGNR